MILSPQDVHHFMSNNMFGDKGNILDEREIESINLK